MSTENKPDTSGLAFPGFRYNCSEDGTEQVDSNTWRCPGMTLRQYAAIHLSVPDSGLPWLDEMIRKKNRSWLCGMALESIVRADPDMKLEAAQIAMVAAHVADALLSELEKK